MTAMTQRRIAVPGTILGTTAALIVLALITGDFLWPIAIVGVLAAGLLWIRPS